MTKTNFRVIIVGGGVAGLALANSLERARIDFVVLEGRNEIAPQVGASIGLLPNGVRILDQLGCYEALLAQLEAIHTEADRDTRGKLYHPKSSTFPLAQTRSGYAVAFGDRQLLLQVMYENIVDKSKVHLSKRVASIEDTADGAKVICSDGSVYEGDVVAGADGVYSKVRQEMWRFADAAEPGLISQEQKQLMVANFKCLYTICRPAQDLGLKGQMNMNYAKDRAIMTAGGPEGRLYIFLFQKLDKTYRVPDIPRYTDSDALEFAESFAQDMVLPDVSFSKIWDSRLSYKLVALEEADFETWTFGRIACFGDSVHKMTPNCGQGGNSSIESAAALTNALKRLVDSTPGRPTKDQVSTALRRFREARRKRMSGVLKSCNNLCHIHTSSNLFNKLLVTRLAHRLGDFLMDLQADVMIGAEKLDFLPPPKRSLQGFMPFNPLQGEGLKESRLKRAVFGFPLLILWYLARYRFMTIDSALPLLVERLTSGKTEWAAGSIPLLYSFYGIKWLDNLLMGIIPAFTSSIFGVDEETRWQSISFLVDLGPVLAIAYIESTRRANAMKPMQFPIVLGYFAQFYGIGASIPLYLYAFWTTTPIAAFRSTDLRLTNLSYTLAILPALILGYYIPTFAQFFHPSLEARQQWNWIWQMWPVWISAIAWLGAKLRTDTIAEDRFYAPKRDLWVIRYTVGATVLVSALTWWSALAWSPCSLAQLFIPEGAPRHGSVEEWIRGFLKWDELFMVGSLFVWLGLSFWDMKYAGMIKTGWVSVIVAALLATLAVGPGAAIGAGWLWREETITHKRHWAAVTETWGEAADEKKDGGTSSGKGVDRRAEKSVVL